MPPTTLVIDLGSTTVIAATAAAGSMQFVRSSPALVGVDGDAVIVGARAHDLSIGHPDAVASQLVRRLGDSAPVILGGRACSIDELLGALIDDCVTAAGVDPATTHLVLTRPAAWREHRLDLLAGLSRDRGFESVEITCGPVVAAATALGEGSGPVIVVDAGGSTIEVSVVSNADVDPVASQNLERLGGNDFDQAVFAHVDTTIDGMLGDLDRRDPHVRQSMLELRQECTRAKERLSTDTETTIPVSFPGLDTSVRITRSEFESLIRPQVEAIVALVDRVMVSAQLSAQQLAGRVMVGGSAHIPLLAELIAGHLGGALTIPPDPTTAVATVAAVAVSTPVPIDSEQTEGNTPMSDDDSTTSSTGTSDTAASSAAPSASTTRTPPPPPPAQKDKSGPSKGAKLAGAAAAAAAVATGAAIAFGDDIADALEGDDPQVTDGDPTVPAPGDGSDDGVADAAAPVGPAGISMDEFDTVAETGGAVAAGAASQARPAAPTQEQRQNDRPDRPDRPDVAPQPASSAAPSQAAPSQAAPSQVAPGQAAPSQVAPTEAAPAAANATSEDDGAVDARFEDARDTLLERLESFSPAGADPEDAAEFRQELQDAISRFEPRQGQSTDDALAELRDDFDRRVEDFTQDQKIDALISEVERDNAEEAAPVSTPGVLVDDFDDLIGADAVIDEPVGDEVGADEAVIDEPVVDEVVVDEPAPSEVVVDDAVLDDLVLEDATLVRAVADGDLIEEAFIEGEAVDGGAIGEPVVVTNLADLAQIDLAPADLADDGVRLDVDDLVATSSMRLPDGPRPTLLGDSPDVAIDDITGDAIYSEIVQAETLSTISPVEGIGVVAPIDDQFSAAVVDMPIFEVAELVDVAQFVVHEQPDDFAADNLEQLEELADTASLPNDDGLGG